MKLSQTSRMMFTSKEFYFQRNHGRRSNPGMFECKQKKQEI